MNSTDIKNATSDLNDDTIPGLTLRVSPTGRKSFYLRYRFSGVQRRPKIGDWPTVNLIGARTVARSWLQQVAAGTDPSAERQKARCGDTVKELCATYMAEHGAAKKSCKSDQSRIDKYVLPAFGSEKVASIDDSHVEKLRKKMKAVPIQFNRTRAMLSKMFNLAEKWKLRPAGTNPCRHVEPYPERKRKRYATREESIAIFERLRHYRAQYPRQVAFLWLLIYTGARPGEIASKGAVLDGNQIVLEDHKTAGATGERREIKLPPQAVEVLAWVADLKPDPRVLGTRIRSPGTLVGIKFPTHLWRKILKDTKIKDLEIYDLRHSFASIGLSHGMSLDELGELLGHKSKETTARYAHLIDEFAQKNVSKVANAFDEFAKPKLAVVK